MFQEAILTWNQKTHVEITPEHKNYVAFGIFIKMSLQIQFIPLYNQGNTTLLISQASICKAVINYTCKCFCKLESTWKQNKSSIHGELLDNFCHF